MDRPKVDEAETQLGEFLDKYDPSIADHARLAVAVLRRHVPAANLLVYDNYNALAIGFASNEKLGGIAFSVTLYPRWVSVFFSVGVDLDDPDGLLKGSGKRIRHIVLTADQTPDDRPILALIDQSLKLLEPPMPTDQAGRLVIKSISPNQRPRRPAS